MSQGVCPLCAYQELAHQAHHAQSMRGIKKDSEGTSEKYHVYRECAIILGEIFTPQVWKAYDMVAKYGANIPPGKRCGELRSFGDTMIRQYFGYYPYQNKRLQVFDQGSMQERCLAGWHQAITSAQYILETCQPEGTAGILNEREIKNLLIKFGTLHIEIFRQYSPEKYHWEENALKKMYEWAESTKTIPQDSPVVGCPAIRKFPRRAVEDKDYSRDTVFSELFSRILHIYKYTLKNPQSVSKLVDTLLCSPSSPLPSATSKT